jgi:hypothetical protein
MTEDRDWAATLTDRIVTTIEGVRDRTTRPAIVAVRGIVFGVVAAFGAITLVVLFIITLVRALNNFIPGDVWIVYLILAGIFLIAGLFLMAKRRPPMTAL